MFTLLPPTWRPACPRLTASAEPPPPLQLSPVTCCSAPDSKLMSVQAVEDAPAAAQVPLRLIRRSKQKEARRPALPTESQQGSGAVHDESGVNQGMTQYMLHLFQIDSMQQWYDKGVEREQDKVAVDKYVNRRDVEPCSKQHRGKSTNTGCIAALTYPDSARVLLKGHKPHDEYLDTLMCDQSVTTAVLWPGDNAITPSELQRIASERTQGRIAVVAVDASWDGSQRMQRRYPPHVLQVKLSPESALRNQAKSLLYPVRRYRGDLESNGRVSTFEAIAALLYELHGNEEHLQTALDNLRIKVDAMLVQKLRPPVYGTVAGDLPKAAQEAAAQRAAARGRGGARAQGGGDSRETGTSEAAGIDSALAAKLLREFRIGDE